MVSLLTGLLGGLLGGSAGDTGPSVPKEGEDALTQQVVDHYSNSRELSSQMAPGGVSNVISQDERLQLISPNQMVHGDFVVNPDIGSQSRQSTQVVMNQVANSANEIVFEFASNQNSVFMKDIRLEMEITIDIEARRGTGCYPVNRITGGQYWWSQFFNQVRVEINGGQAVITDIGALRAIMLAMESLNPNDAIDLGALRRHIDTNSLNCGDYTQEIDIETPNIIDEVHAIPYQGSKFYQTVYLPLTFFDIKDLLAPNSILKITFVRNATPVTLFASSGQGSGMSGGAALNNAPLVDLRLWQVSLSGLSQWMTVFECNPAKMRADALAHTVSGTPNQLVWYLPQHMNFPMTGGAFKTWGTYNTPGQGAYATYTEELVLQGTGVAPNNYVIVPEVTWEVWMMPGGVGPLANTNTKWTECVPGLVTLETVSINSVPMNYPSSILPTNLLTGLASGSFEAYMKLAKYRARSATTERFSQKQLNAGTWKKFLRWIDHSYSPYLGCCETPVLVNAASYAEAAHGAIGNHASETFTQIPWEKLRKMPYTIVNTVLNEDPYVIVTPQRETVRVTLRLMQNFFLMESQPVRGTALHLAPAALQDNPSTNTPYIPYLGEKQLYFVGVKTQRNMILKNPTLNLRVVSLNITMTEYGEYGMTVTNTNLYEKIGAVGGV
jgi:hypothetical protein